MSDTRLVAGLKTALSDIDPFSHHILGRRLREYQVAPARAIMKSIANHEGHQFVVMMPRQAGKNEMSAQLEAFALARYAAVDRASIVKAAPTFKPQLINSIRRLRELVERSPALANMARMRLGYILELGKASITFFSAEPSAQVVGATASLLLECDEAQDVEQAKWDKDFRPMGATGNATGVFYGTPWARDDLLARELERARDTSTSAARRAWVIPWERVADANPLYGVHVEREIARLGREHPIIRTQYLLDPMDRAGALFSDEQIAKLEGDHPRARTLALAAPIFRPGMYGGTVAGLDCAGEIERDASDESDATPTTERRRDSTVLWIAALDLSRQVPGVFEPIVRVLDIYQWRGTPHHELLPTVRQILHAWKVQRVVVDATGVGGGFATYLIAAMGKNAVDAYKYTEQTKSDLGYSLIEAVNSGRLLLYSGTDDEKREAIAQFKHAQYELRQHSRIRWQVPEHRGHDDHLNAAALVTIAAAYKPSRSAAGAKKAKPAAAPSRFDRR